MLHSSFDVGAEVDMDVEQHPPGPGPAAVPPRVNLHGDWSFSPFKRPYSAVTSDPSSAVSDTPIGTPHTLPFRPIRALRRFRTSHWSPKISRLTGSPSARGKRSVESDPYLDIEAYPIIFDRILYFLEALDIDTVTTSIEDLKGKVKRTRRAYEADAGVLSNQKERDGSGRRTLWDMLRVSWAVYEHVGQRLYKVLDLGKEARVGGKLWVGLELGMPRGVSSELGSASGFEDRMGGQQDMDVELDGHARAFARKCSVASTTAPAIPSNSVALQPSSIHAPLSLKAILFTFTQVIRSQAHPSHRCLFHTHYPSLGFPSLRTWVYDISTTPDRSLEHVCKAGPVSCSAGAPHIAIVGLHSVSDAAASTVLAIENDAARQTQELTLVLCAASGRPAAPVCEHDAREAITLGIKGEDDDALNLLEAAVTAHGIDAAQRPHLRKITIVCAPALSKQFGWGFTVYDPSVRRHHPRQKNNAQVLVDLVWKLCGIPSLQVVVVGWEGLLNADSPWQSSIMQDAFKPPSAGDAPSHMKVGPRSPRAPVGEAKAGFSQDIGHSSAPATASTVAQWQTPLRPYGPPKLVNFRRYLDSLDAHDIFGQEWCDRKGWEMDAPESVGWVQRIRMMNKAMEQDGEGDAGDRGSD